MAKFATRLTALREERKLTQKELAEKLGLSSSAISMYEIGKREPDFETLELIADYFNVSMDYLIGKEDIATQIDLIELREELRRKPGMRMLFSLAKNATNEDLEAVAKLMQHFKGED